MHQPSASGHGGARHCGEEREAVLGLEDGALVELRAQAPLHRLVDDPSGGVVPATGAEPAPGGGFTSAPKEITPRYTTWEGARRLEEHGPVSVRRGQRELLARERVGEAGEGPVTSPSVSLTSSSLHMIGLIDTAVTPDSRPPPSIALYVKDPGVVKSRGGLVAGGLYVTVPSGLTSTEAPAGSCSRCP